MINAYIHTQETPGTTWTITHGLDTDRVTIDCAIVVSDEYVKALPESITYTDNNTVTVSWSSNQQGSARVVAGN